MVVMVVVHSLNIILLMALHQFQQVVQGNSGQGNPGGGNARNTTPNFIPTNGIIGGGGGGAGGAGQRAYTEHPYPQSTQYPSTKFYAGNGGSGLSVPEFPMPLYHSTRSNTRNCYAI